MTSIIDRKDLSDGDKVKLYNKVLQRYNDLKDRRAKAPTRVVVVNEDESIPAAAAAAAPVEVPKDVDDLVATFPKAMQVKARRLMESFKKKGRVDRSMRVDTRRRAGTRMQRDGSRERPVEKDEKERSHGVAIVCTAAQTHQPNHGVDR